MRNVAVFLFGQVLLWCVRPIFPVAPVGDFVATHAVWVSPRSRQEVTTKRGRAKTPTMLPKRWTEYETGAPLRTQVSNVSGQLLNMNAEVSSTNSVPGSAM